MCAECVGEIGDASDFEESDDGEDDKPKDHE